MDKLKAAKLYDELQRRKRLEEDLKNTKKFTLDNYCFDKQKEFLRGPGARFRTAVCSRRAGKCRSEGSLIKTPKGSVKIEDLRPGDEVYGYDNDGVVRVCKVTKLWDQGVKEVVDLMWNGQVMATSTLDHKWLAENSHKGSRKVKRLKDFNYRDKVAEEYVPIPGGDREVPEAYALGALLGDGCSREGGVFISSEDEDVVNKCAKSLGSVDVHKRLGNYSWSIKGLSQHGSKPLQLYNKWCRGRYAHEKTFDLAEVRSWNRKSQIEFLAGLVDTDGSVQTTKDGRLKVSIGMQAEEVIRNCQMLILDLFQYKAAIIVDDRKKYKNGPVYELRVCNNKFSKRILKELPVVVERKKYKPEYDRLNERNTHPKRIGVKLSKPYKAQCYDITIDNDSHLFLDANGMIGHNTIGIVADMYETCMTEENSTVLYLTVTKENARNIIWGEVTRLAENYKIDCKLDNLRLQVNFPNGSRILCAGAKDRSEIEKYRGFKLRKCYLDECQSFRTYIKDLVNDIITPALRDLRGELYLTGTPGPVPVGYFYECSHSDEWENFRWTAFDNPHMHDPENGKDLEDTLEEERRLKGITKSDPSYIRETYGQWVEDLDALVFRFSKESNVFTTLPKADYSYVLGIDLGYNDSDAIAVLAYDNQTKVVYLVEEYLKSKQGTTELMNEIKRLQDKYNPVKMVMDSGGLGKKIMEELRTRHAISLVAAEKHRKLEFIELLNDDLRTGKLKAFPQSAFEDDCMLVQWDKESKARNPERPRISDTYHSDICDAVLYAWRECKHFHNEKPKKTPARNSDDYMKMLEQREAEAMEARKNPLNDLQESFADDFSDLDDLIDWD